MFAINVQWFLVHSCCGMKSLAGEYNWGVGSLIKILAAKENLIL